jgi:hypothetical protein
MNKVLTIRRRMARNYAKMGRELDKLDKLLRRMEAALQGKRRS